MGHERQSRSASSHVISEPVSGLAHHLQAWSPDWPALKLPHTLELVPDFLQPGAAQLGCAWGGKQAEAGRHPSTSRSQHSADFAPPRMGKLATCISWNQATSCRGRRVTHLHAVPGSYHPLQVCLWVERECGPSSQPRSACKRSTTRALHAGNVLTMYCVLSFDRQKLRSCSTSFEDFEQRKNKHTTPRIPQSSPT